MEKRQLGVGIDLAWLNTKGAEQSTGMAARRKGTLWAIVGILTWCQAANASSIVGRVLTPVSALADTTILLHTADGQLRIEYPEADGTFTFNDVPSGISLVQASHVNYYYAETKVEVYRGEVQRAALIIQTTTGTQIVGLQLPLLLKPGAEFQYFEKRKAVDVWSFVKSPYGLMIVFSLFIILVLPRMKMDPEDLAAVQEQEARLKGISGAQGGGTGTAAGAGGQQQRLASSKSK